MYEWKLSRSGNYMSLLESLKILYFAPIQVELKKIARKSS